MKLNADSLSGHLARNLKPAYLVSGDEPLLVAEATDAIRRKARESGFTERRVFFIERGFDWNALRAESRSLSLFSERRILDVRMPGGKPGDGADLRHTASYSGGNCRRSPPDTRPRPGVLPGDSQ